MILYEDRREAAGHLTRALRHYRGTGPLVLALPTGAVAIAAEVARALAGELDVVLVDLLGAPGRPDSFAGAVDETGWTFRAPGVEWVGEDHPRFVTDAKAHVSALRARRSRLTPDRAAPELRGRTVIVVDDGGGSWHELVVALHSARAKDPAALVFATPVASADGLAYFASLADDVVCLAAPCPFEGAGHHFGRFERLDDTAVSEILAGFPHHPLLPSRGVTMTRAMAWGA